MSITNKTLDEIKEVLEDIASMSTADELLDGLLSVLKELCCAQGEKGCEWYKEYEDAIKNNKGGCATTKIGMTDKITEVLEWIHPGYLIVIHEGLADVEDVLYFNNNVIDEFQYYEWGYDSNNPVPPPVIQPRIKQ